MQIFELFGSVLLKDSNVESQLDKFDKKARGTEKGMNGSFKNIISGALKLGAVLGVGLGIKEMITTAAAGQEKLAQMDAVLKSTHGSAGMTKNALVDLAGSLAKTTTFSKGTTMAGENLLLTFTGIGKKVFPDTIKAAQDMSTAMGTDLNSSVMLLGKSMNDPVAGMGRLAKSGVTFTKVQKDQVAAMQKAGNMAGAQKIILAELAKEFGGSATAKAKTFNGQITILKNGLIGMGASIGTTLMPYLTNFTKYLNDNMPKIKQVLTNVINAIVPKFQEWIKLIVQIAQELLPNFGKASEGVKGKMDLFKGTLDLVTNVLTLIKDNINLVKGSLVALGAIWIIHTGYVIACNTALALHKIAQAANILMNGTEATTTGISTVARIAHTVATGIATTATSLFAAATWTAILPIVAIIASLALLGVGIYEIVKHWDVVKAKTVSVWGTIKTFLVKVFNDIKGFIVKWGPEILLVIAPFLGIPLIIFQHWTQISTKLNEVWSKVKSVVSSGVRSVSNTVANGFNSAIDFIKSLPGKAIGWGKDFIDGLVSGITSMIGKVTSAVSGVANTIKGFLHFSTPDVGPLKNYGEWMPDFMDGMAKGINNNKFKVIDSLKALTGDMTVNASVTANKNSLPISSDKTDSGTKSIDGGITLHIDKFVNNSKEDIEELAQELAIFFKQKKKALGGV